MLASTFLADPVSTGAQLWHNSSNVIFAAGETVQEVFVTASASRTGEVG